ncbi:hypothetical protein F4553_001914 [Allocatelliglobosispora scoriae]|uniref:Uncharacterized protein n=1 Tax=Allocatelliglobosispora scoriae TaxID=643052 RepID=A0A841BLL4_9ACTN|nr:hypothetical protein [Allocatelliglobosispora scoriae]MBB5868535.1 hypothetical protein [Allocatelliglobosispora scoriae]
MAYRYRCGECEFKTAWLTEFQGAQHQLYHYAQRHPGIPPGGQVEIGQESPSPSLDTGNGCLKVIGAVIVLLVLVALCRR